MTRRARVTKVTPEIERVARAICLASGADPNSHDANKQPAWIAHISVAKAAHSALLTNEDGERLLTLTTDEASRICKRLEFDASWDKAGSGYYSLKRQLQSD
jgi:hypothetical protein